ncbi:inorganic pyrophosphatase Ppa [uncultured Desulfobacter sp.]|uniref:inorganic pyrophosphatase Ppa n=1 Tax=uncultured Desulfobacter sp. TaxID=240139 RepID=UPI002AAAD8BF|nr:inorganic pyrophosphatase Ppa [uncultured Desulfobacter sp.]
MTIDKFIKLKEGLELQKYVRNLDFDKKNCCSFYGSPKKHPHEKNRVILVADPFSEHTFYYQFNIQDILYIEEQPSITNMDGESVSMVRLWVKKKCIGLQCLPFAVGDISKLD